jgi:hypothetical protein
MVGLLLLDSLGFDLGGIADPKLETQFCQQSTLPSLWSSINHRLLGSRSRHCYAIGDLFRTATMRRLKCFPP